jgi:hypothetical protein
MTEAINLLVWATVLPVVVVLVLAARHDHVDDEGAKQPEGSAEEVPQPGAQSPRHPV